MALDEYMKANGFNQAEVAAKLDVSQSFVARVLDGQRTPSPRMAKRWEAVTGIPAERFIFAERAA